MEKETGTVPLETGKAVAPQKELVLAGGCFWGTEAYFSQTPGVEQVLVGYANGRTPSPSYEAVCTGTTGYAEALWIRYDTRVLSLEFLLAMYYKTIDPTSVNRQGGDVGEQYRTGIFFVDPVDEGVIKESVSRLEADLGEPLAIIVEPLDCFYPAEDSHQRYLEKNPGGYCHIPKPLLEYGRSAREYRRPSQEQLKKELTLFAYEVTQNNATELPFDNAYDGNFEPGIYVDVTTGEPLFLSTDKFESGCGWPSFARPIGEELLTRLEDTSRGRVRTEVRSTTGDAHLGHVFEDGPTELGGLRYCINSAALRFVPMGEMEQQGYGHYLSLVEAETGSR